MINKVEKITFADVRSIKPGEFKIFQLPSNANLRNARATAYMCGICSGFKVHMASDVPNRTIQITRLAKEEERK